MPARPPPEELPDRIEELQARADAGPRPDPGHAGPRPDPGDAGRARIRVTWGEQGVDADVTRVTLA